MKLTANEILNTYDSLAKIADKETDFDTACTIASNIKELEMVKQIFEKKRNGIVTKYADKNEDGSIKQKDDGQVNINDMNGFIEEMNKLLSSETEIELRLINKSALSELKVSAKEAIGLMNIIKD